MTLAAHSDAGRSGDRRLGALATGLHLVGTAVLALAGFHLVLVLNLGDTIQGILAGLVTPKILLESGQLGLYTLLLLGHG